MSTETITPPALPEDLYAHLRDLNPRSFEFSQELSALNSLARETGHILLTTENIFPPIKMSPPLGYESSTLFPFGGEVPTEQFKGVIHSLASEDPKIEVDVQSLRTDSGKDIRYCDLRPFMTSSVRKSGPETSRGQESLDKVVLRDLKFFSETGHAKLSVHGVRGVFYTRLGNTKTRAYWMPVEDLRSPDGVPTIARIADSGDSIAAESDLYRRVFQRKL